MAATKSAIGEAEHALAIDPNHTGAHYAFGDTKRYSGLFDEAIGLIERAMRLNPNATYPIWGLRPPRPAPRFDAPKGILLE